ncbi:MAG: MFS transporter [Candidatus Heimdallarchaeota archaeon]|nr:MAG: MFS transporter [Candidatus Heimdallarchaeota archaeon]
MSIRTIFPIGIFQFISFLRRAVFYAFFYLYLRTFLGLPNTLAALLGTANLIGSTFGQLKLWGPRLNDRPSLARPYVVRGELIAAFTYLLAFIGHYFLLELGSKIGAAFLMIILLSILEIFWSMSDLGVRFLVAQATEGNQRGQLVGFIDGFGLIGQIVGFLLSGLLYRDGLGFSEGTIFYVVVILMILCATVIQFSPQVEKIDFDRTTIVSKAIRELLTNRSYLIFILCIGLLVIGISSSTQIFLYYSNDPTGLSFDNTFISYLLILFSLTGGLIAPIGGRISDKIGRIPIVVLTGFGAGICYFLFFLLGNQPFLIIAIIYSLLGGCSSLLQSVSFAYTADLLPDELRGTGFAVFNITLATGWGLAGFIVGGPVADLLIFLGEPTVVAYRIAFLVSSLVILLGTLALTLYLKSSKRILMAINDEIN